ncbi:MAG: CDP-diacylglycerol--glycerol-3-phosphate 3-phosphatidyltransferase [Chloroflexaceae bacterium]|nr:CDP-diacylglycerol--glycerol-3-phosphate 3-phosphatidyltransferase [Chloroflexaceae bacterium]
MFSTRSLPNLLGLFRIVTAPLLVWLILLNNSVAYLWAVLLLLLMAASDIADGKIARRLQAVSPLGIFLDTISDKIFVASALLPLVQHGIVWSWVALLIIVREFVISGLRSYAAAEGQVIPAGKWGKQKLVVQVTALVWCLLAASAATGGFLGTLLNGMLLPLLNLWPVVMGLAVVWTVGSALDYIWKAWPLLRGSWEPRPVSPPEPPQRQAKKQL